MSDNFMFMIEDDGEATLYDDTYDIVIHCVSKEEQDEARRSLENVPHWIPVTERLPEAGETVLFCDYDRDIYVGHRTIEHWWSVDDKVKNVTAWMPLPEPYKGVTE